MIWRRALLGEGCRRLAARWVRRGVLVVTAGGVAAACAGLPTGAGAAQAAGGARAAAPSVQWGRAEEVPGSGRLNTWGNASATSLSCWSVNNCAAAGYYNDSRGQHPLLVSERGGRWGRARQVPGLAALNARGNAQVNSVSCAPGGYCVAGGYYTDAAGHVQGFVVTGVKGRWRRVVKVPGLTALNTSGDAQVNSVSCPAAGKCAAAGSYTGASGGQGFVVSQANGVWGTAREVPGLAVLNVGGNAGVASLSCGSAGNCAAGGSYTSTSLPITGRPAIQVFVVSEVHGVWRSAEGVPGSAALNTAGNAQVYSVSCARDGYCAIGGSYQRSPDEGSFDSPFVASGRDGRWGAAVALGGPAIGLDGFDTDVNSVSCPSAGSCVAVGGTDGYCCDANGDAYDESFEATQTKGVWGGADLLRGGWAQGDAYSVSCPSAGNCGVGGDGGPAASLYGGGFVASQTNGRWTKAKEVPGMTAIGDFGSSVSSVSCPSAGHCTVAGSYQDANNAGQGFVTAPR